MVKRSLSSFLARSLSSERREEKKDLVSKKTIEDLLEKLILRVEKEKEALKGSVSSL